MPRLEERRKVDSFDRVFETLRRSEATGDVSPEEARERISDAVRLAARVRRLEERLGRSGLAEASPYLRSLLRLASGSKIVEPAVLRRAASF
jgi:hypothetical protein